MPSLIPLSGDADAQRIKGKIPRRLIVRYGDNPGDMAIAVTAPVGPAWKKWKSNRVLTSSEIEQAVTYVLTGILDLASAVESA